MDQREFHLLGIFYRLYHFITKTLASGALKTVTLGRSKRYSSTSTAPRGSDPKADKVVDKELPPTEGLLGDSISSPAQQAEDKNNPCMKADEMAGENTATLPTASLPQTKSLKKVASISDNVEEILPSKKKRSKSFRKKNSRDLEEEEEPKPLRSILKVGSDLNDKPNSIC